MSPNFITTSRVHAPIIVLSATTSFKTNVAGKIVCIVSADPGFDWIFPMGVAGLITMYGGSNSHMGIRCAEFNIPAAIGCGDELFKVLCSAQEATLDCENEVVTPIKLNILGGS